MKKNIFIIATLVACMLTLNVDAKRKRNTDKTLEHRQEKQESVIENGYNSGEISELEYYKLKREQDAIAKKIHRAKRNGRVSYDERREITKNLDKSSKRISRYQRNRETAYAN
jgi:hypothetical protein